MEQRTPLAGPRLVLRRLRDVMARAGSAQERLDQIVRLVAGEMVAEVCSIYVLRAGEVLELYATQGLNPDAVHRTRLRVGEGIVGDIAAHARALSLADAQSHPNFAYRPETGEEIYHSMAGVPILRGDRVLGVLAIQNRRSRQYDEEEIETLQNVAMVLAELVAGGELVNPNEIKQVDGIGLLPIRLDGVQLNGGVAIGRAVLHEPRIFISRVVAEDPKTELKRFGDALHGVRADLDRMLEDGDLGHGEHREVLETFRMFADDRGWVERIREGIGDGLTAEAAVQRAFDDTRARFADITDSYIRERLSDLSDLTNRLLLRLSGRNSAVDPTQWSDEMVVVARDLGPAELLEYDRSKLRGLVLEEGSALSHVAIVARALDIPVVGRVENILQRVEPGDALIVDGDSAQVFVRPAEEIQLQIADTISLREAQRQEYARLRDLPAATRDGVAVSLRINAGLMIDLNHLEPTGADGVGLYRTEIPFMVRSTFPDVEEQTSIYARVLDAAAGRPVAFRTLDVGGDKVLPYVGAFDDENPAMGWRAIRIGLDRPAMLRRQLRALVAAAGARPLQVMFPMVADVAEFRAASHLLELELHRAKARGAAIPARLSVGVMLEVPSLIWQLDALLAEVDFVSIGTNDLMQFLFAADRGNTRLGNRYDCLSPAALRVLQFVVEGCNKADVEVSVCGEMAGRPIEALALLGLGVRTLSMSPGSLGAVKSMLRSLDLAHFAAYLQGLLGGSERSLRDKIALYARDRSVRL